MPLIDDRPIFFDLVCARHLGTALDHRHFGPGAVAGNTRAALAVLALLFVSLGLAASI